MATISSPGLGSGLDVNSIVSQLVALERRPIDLLQQQQAALQAKLSAFGLLQSYTVNVRDAVARLAEPDLWTAPKATSSAAAVTASASAGATPGTYQVQVNRLAQAHALASSAYPVSSAPTGSGTLHIELGAWDDGLTSFTRKSGTSAVDIVIPPGADSLEQVRAAVNAAGAGVTASIVNDASGARLVLRSSATGAGQALRITTTPDAPAAPGGPTLDALAFDPPASGASGLQQTMAALDASVTVDGLEISSAGNTLNGVVDGLNLTLTATTTAPVSVSVALDSASIRTKIDDFVKAYNEINRYLHDQTKYDPDTKKGGTLQGDAATRTVMNQLRMALTQARGSAGSLRQLSDVGLQLQRDGSLKVDAGKLDAALADPAAVQAAFSADEQGVANDGFAVRIKALTGLLTNSDGPISTRTDGLRTSISRADKQIARYEDRITQTQARLLRQYSALDTTLSQLQGLNSYVTQQIANWNRDTSR
ncbi:MAG: flagellar filament capping protein FliD [Rubrivivax sp.]